MAMFFNGTPSITPYNNAQNEARNNLLLDDLVAAWEFNEVSGTRADSHTNSLDLTDNNTVGSASNGGLTVADFERNNDEYLSGNYSLLRFTNTFTFETWIRIESIGTNPLTPLGVWGLSAASNEALYRAIISTSGDLSFDIRDNTNTFRRATYGTTLSTATDYQVIVYFDSSAGEIGVTVNNDTFNTTATPSILQTPAASEPFEYGREAAQRYYDGLAWRTRAWSRLLTGAEITDLYNSGSGRAYSYFE